MHFCCCNGLQPQEDSQTKFKILIGHLRPTTRVFLRLVCALDHQLRHCTSKEKCYARYEYTPEQQIFNKRALFKRD
jgi:hypothetical protein